MTDQAATLTIEVKPDQTQLIRAGEAAMDVACAYEIDSPEAAALVSQARNENKAQIQVLKDLRKKITEPAEQIIATAREWFSPAIQRREEADAHYGKLLVEYRDREARRIQEENRKREEEVRRLRAEAEEKAAADRARAEQRAQEERARQETAEKQRKEAEERARQEEQARLEAERKAEAERRATEAALRAAAEAKAAGDAARAAQAEAEAEAAQAREKAARAAQARADAEAKAAADAAAQAAAEAAASAQRAEQVVASAERNALTAKMAIDPVPVEIVQPIKIAGTDFRKKWQAQLAPGFTPESAKAAIVKAAVETPTLLGLIDIDQKALGKMAEALGSAMVVPGYQAVQASIAVKSRAKR